MTNTHIHGNILDEIIAHKREEITQLKEVVPQSTVLQQAMDAPPPRDFIAALQAPGVSLIAEVKKASPSKGLLCPNFDPVTLAQTYADNGAAAISVLTDEHFFQGHIDYLRAIHQAVDVPLLRKDFIIDLYQVYEARAAGADAILLIVAAVDDAAMHNIYALARHLGMAVLVEIHNLPELRRALILRPRLIGINNRNLNTFEVSLDTTADLRPRLPRHTTIVTESGIHTPSDVKRLELFDVDAMLVGEALVTAADVAAKVRELAGS